MGSQLAPQWHTEERKQVLSTGNDVKYIIVDARDTDDDPEVHASSYDRLRHLWNTDTNRLGDSLKVAGDQLLDHLASRTPNPSVICVAGNRGKSNAPFIAESLPEVLKKQLETSRKIDYKHLNGESPTKKCSFSKS